MHPRSSGVTGGEQPAHHPQSSREAEEQGSSRGQNRGRSVSPVAVSNVPPQQKSGSIPHLIPEVVTNIFRYTKLADRCALQLTCKDFREIGNIPGIVERQTVNTYKGIPHDLLEITPGQSLIAALKKKTNIKLARSQPAHQLLANHLKVYPSQCLKTLTGHMERVAGLARLKNGQIASHSRDMTIKTWNLETGKCYRTLGGPTQHSNWINRVIPLGDDLLASCSHDETIKIWHPEEGRCLKTLYGHDSYVLDVISLDNNRKLISCSSDHTIKIWNPETGTCLKTLRGHTGWVTGIAHLRNGQIVSCSEDNTIRIWNPETGECLKTLEAEDPDLGDCRGVICLENGHLALLYQYAGTIVTRNPETGQLIKTFGGRQHRYVNSVCSLGNGQIISCSDDKTIKIWDLATGECLKTLSEPIGHTRQVMDVIPLGDGQFASCSNDWTIKIWGYGY